MSACAVRAALLVTLTLLGGVAAQASCLDSLAAHLEPAAKDEKEFKMAAFNGKSIAFRKYCVFRFQHGRV